jgi:alpha-tubulin suppressor-like RCC1 family protein
MLMRASVALGGGDLYMWGCGLDGRLGVGSEHDQLSPQFVFALKGQPVTGVSAGGFHTLALTGAGHVYSWGYGGTGRLGHGDRANRALPEWVESLRHTNVTQVAAGGAHSLALTAAGDVLCWGEGAMGQLGLGTADSVSLPQYVPTLRGCGVTAIAAGWRHSLALMRGDGGTRPVVYAWGDNAYVLRRACDGLC